MHNPNIFRHSKGDLIEITFPCKLEILCFTAYMMLAACTNAQNSPKTGEEKSFVYSRAELEQMMTKPACLGEYRTSLSGPLRKPDGKGGFIADSTFTVEVIKVPSEGFLIHGWLYLPRGNEKCPLVVLTNGGGDGSRSIKSFSDFMAPILAHCGIAAFVHDKRGTGESEGIYVNTTYNDYITDAGNCGIFLSGHKRINPELIGVMGASEGGRVAVMAASRFPVFSFVISQAGTVVTPIEDRLNAQLNGMTDQGVISDSIAMLVRPLWEKSFRAWAVNDPSEHEKVNKEIAEWRGKFDRDILPYTKQEMDSIPAFSVILPTWNSLGNDYLTELGRFRKKWLAIFGEIDRVVPTEASVRNIIHYMSSSGNESYNIAIIPRMGHVPVDTETGDRVNFDFLIVNWIRQSVMDLNQTITTP